MSELVFRCPYTNKRLLSGIEIDRDSARHIQELPLRMQCPHCGLHHDGVIGDGELSDAVAQRG
ncbi:MAG: hypothetical protein ACLPKB_18470 [Xanthobacteraceae bacterium]